ncbi:ATP-dependent DNA helicase RecG [Aequitasia blattaphilus]|uniref:DNA binding domain-containing protein n=1 Tax=Aequitasia blattaphilus TaxID=2949332 RepID=A0ABT1EA54_9FIRM|nr:RNA-binding domain-containing protein [Aequitasia blattaphilus]MCP1101392.1 putative DNA binding domain-containing protein [Aequitasia blattaphilus]MCR8614032.1 putative DNA binding domain-containing protein [Aequitasia blattaphilus]
MDAKAMKQVLDVGETIAVEFKRCGNGIESDTYETVCSFLNRFGGDIYLGVKDNGEVRGVSEKVAPELVKNFIKNINNPNILQPTVYLEPKIIKYEGKTIIHIHIPPSSEVHSYKKDIYDRVDDADIKVTATSQIAALYIRKQNIYTEKKVFPYLELEDLRLDLLPRIKQMAINHAGGKHPWESMNDEDVLKSAGLYGKDAVTGKAGYNLAAAMLLGKDSMILSVAPGYRTDALLRKVNVDRYDDRLIVETNLVESYDLLMGFAEKHLWDKFYLEGDRRMSLRNIIAREMLVNTLIHREITSSYIAKFVIEKDRMFVENANRATHDGVLTPDDFEPNPKNPIIASFFRNIGLSDQLGSGVRNLFKYGKLYSGTEPKIIEGDVFRIVMPLDDEYSFDMNTKISDKKSAIKISDKKSAIKTSNKKSKNYVRILAYMKNRQAYKTKEIAEVLGIQSPQTRSLLNDLVKQGKIEALGENRNRTYKLKE